MADVELTHPETGAIIEVPEGTAHVHARAGWVRTDGKDIAQPYVWTPENPEPPAGTAAGGETVDLRAAFETAVLEHGHDSPEADEALAALQAAENTSTDNPAGTPGQED